MTKKQSLKPIISWIEFFQVWWHLLDEEQRLISVSEMLDGKSPPDLEAPMELMRVENDRFKRHIGSVIKRFRRDMDAQTLAKIMGKSPAYISLVENGNRAISTYELYNVMRVLSIPPSEIFDKVPLK